MFHFVYRQTGVAVIALVIGLVLTIASIAGWVKEGIEDKHGYSAGYSVWAMPLLIVSEALLFVAFFAAYWTLRLRAPFWPPAGTPEMQHAIPILMTIILVASSVTMHFAEKALDTEKGDRGGFLTWLIVTILLGLVFIGLSAYEWSELIGHGFTAGTNIYSSAFYTITGFHGSHVFVGLGIFVCILIPALAGKISEPFVKSASIYWHFVDIVWLFVVSQVYFW
jgi:cytochrome c oxidase subunit 3